MNMQDAANRADGILDATLGAISPQVKWVHGPTTVGSCDLTRRRAVVTSISPERRGSFLGVVERFWQQKKLTIKSVNNSKRFPAVYAQSADGFGVSLSVGAEGQAFFEVDSPCVDPSDVAEPAARANGPAYVSGPIPRPNVQDDFWSSSEPLASSSPATP